MLKNIFIIFFATFLTLNLAACGESKEEPKKEKTGYKLTDKTSKW